MTTTMMTISRRRLVLLLVGKKSKKVQTITTPHLPPRLSSSAPPSLSSSSPFFVPSTFQSRSFSYNHSNNNNNYNYNGRRNNGYSNNYDASSNNRNNSNNGRFPPPNNYNYNYNNYSNNYNNYNDSNSKIFVSRYNNSLNVSANDIIEYCQSHIIPNTTTATTTSSSTSCTTTYTRRTSTHVIVRECPFCHKPTNGKIDNMYKLYIQIGSGAYFCHRCGVGGSWYDFKSQLNSSNCSAGSNPNHNVSSIGMNMNMNMNTNTNTNMNYGAGAFGGGRMTGAAVAGGGGGSSLLSSFGGPGTRMGGGNNYYGCSSSSGHNNNNYSNGRSGFSSSPQYQHQGWQQQDQSQMTTMMGHQNYNQHQNLHNPRNSHSSVLGDDGTTPCLPLPAARLSGYYSSRLLDDNSSNDNDDDSTTTRSDLENNNMSENNASSSSSSSSSSSNAVLRYLETVRGLNRTTLRKYGVGRATYKFPSEQGGYQDAECVTFPWIMRESDVQLQESLRGAKFVHTNNKQNNEGRNTQDNGECESKTPSTVITTGAGASSASRISNETGEDQKPADGSETKQPPTAKDDVDTISPIPPTPTSPPVSQDHDDITAAPTGAFVTRRIKVRALQQKSWQRLDPPGGGWGLFGLHTVPDDATEIVLTEGEYDAMAVSQATGRPAVSLPNGCRSLPVQVLPLLERFEKIYLWMDNDQPGQEGAEKFAKKLGLNRCYIVHCTEAKDANDALLKGTVDLNEKLQQAQLVPHERILTFQDLRHDVLHELLEPDKYSGVAVPSLPIFTRLIKGFRRGELTVMTGPTGSGKTTFLGQVSLDLAEQGINVLWGSFEIKNTRLLHKLLRQFSRNSLPDSKAANASELLQSLADRFQSLPLYFMKFHGGSDVDEVLDAMEYAVYVNDVEHIVLDNMQFMISRNNQRNSFDKFDVQDIAIEKFRKFATEHNVHVTLVVHPRKEDEASKLGISSFFGSAKATQEADTVLILQNDGRRKYIDVKKNRFDGTLGYSPLYFQSSSGRYVENEMEADRQQIQTMTPMQYQPTEKKSPTPQIRPDLENHWQFPTSVPQNRA